MGKGRLVVDIRCVSCSIIFSQLRGRLGRYSVVTLCAPADGKLSAERRWLGGSHERLEDAHGHVGDAR